jgi:hypothetical protein
MRPRNEQHKRMAKGGGHREGRSRLTGEGKWGQEMSNLRGIREWQKEEGTERGKTRKSSFHGEGKWGQESNLRGIR